MRKGFFALVVVALMAPAAIALSQSIQQTINNFGYHVKTWNIGMSTALMANLDQTAAHTTCVTAAVATSDEIFKLLAFD